MKITNLSLANIVAIAHLWRDMGGHAEVDIGALEPLLWRDGQYRIHDVVSALTQCGFKVSMTTNGQLLDIFANRLYKAGLSLIRTSWHSTNPALFKEISGGHGDYARFLRGLTFSLESGIKVSFNRVLLKGCTDDLADQMVFVTRYKSRLKLHTLMWTPNSADSYRMFYQDWHSAIRTSVLPRTVKITRTRKRHYRGRLQFHLEGGGLVEVKLGEKVDRTMYPCVSCAFKNDCEEAFGDYVRIDPRLDLYFCYMNRSIGLPVAGYLGRSAELKQRLQELLCGIDVEHVLASTSLRLTITPVCNFNCRAPGARQGWCMEKPGEYVYPRLRPSVWQVQTT